MKSTEEISEFINAVRQLSGAGICYYDLRNFFNYNKYGIRNNRGHYCDFCIHAKTLVRGQANCDKSDRIDAVALAEEYREPFFFECHMGIRELVIPLINEDKLIGILFVGQCRIEGESMQKNVAQGVERLGGSSAKFIALYEQLPVVKRENLLNIGKILSHYFDMKIINSELIMPSVKSEKEGSLATRIWNYVNSNYNRDISTKTIATEFFVNPSYVSRNFRQKYHITITDYIQHIRVERAKILLTTTSVPINSIAINVGFSDGNYFARVFKKHVGVAPKEYRSAHSYGMEK